MRLRPKPNATPDDVAFGVNAVSVALSQGLVRTLLYFEATANDRVRTLAEQAAGAGIGIQPVPAQRLDQLTGGAVHQGVLARLRALPTIDIRTLPGAPSTAFAVLLDGITDPQNLGAILRTAVAVGAGAVILPRRRGALLTPGVHRASAGMSFIAPVAAPQNLAAAIRELRDAGFWVVASDMTEAADATAFDWPARTALIMGGEERGVSRLLSDLADFTVRLPMDPRVDSLNVGVAFGALAYLWRRQWPASEFTTGGAISTS